MEENFRLIINNLMEQINQATLNDYKNLPPEIIEKLKNFNKEKIVYFYEQYSGIVDKSDSNKLYINCSSFMENQEFDINKIEKNKKLMIETYFKKIVLNNQNEIKLNPYLSNNEEINNFINRHNFKISNKLQNKEQVSDKEVIAQSFNIDIDNIDTIIISGHIYYKFVIDGAPQLIETLNENGLQSEISPDLTNLEIQKKLKDEKMQLSIIPVNEISQHPKELNSLSKEQYEKLQALLRQQQKLNIRYINLSNGIALKENGEYVYAEKNEKGEYEVKDAYAKETTETDENELQDEYTKEKQKVLTLKINNTGASSILILSLITSFVGGLILTILFTLIK